MQPNLHPPRLMLHSSMSVGTKEEAVAEGQWNPSVLTLSHCLVSGLGFWMDKSKPSWGRGDLRHRAFPAVPPPCSSANSMGIRNTRPPVSPRATQGWVQPVQAEPSPGPSWTRGAADRADMEALTN